MALEVSCVKVVLAIMDKVVLILLVLVASSSPLNDDANVSLSRTRRQNQQEHMQPLLNPPIPTSVGHYLGGDQPVDSCVRDEVLVKGGCHRLLTQGPCAKDEYVLLDPADQKGYCASRLCAPDRIFVFSDQMCHDPRNTRLCPPGRHLYQTAYGTPVCQCPDGTYEGDDDLDDDVCDPLLGRTLNCPPNQVLWFRNFKMPPECLPDPCGGENLNRGPNDLPFVPSAADGKCYQLGQSPGVCPAQTWYSLALEALKGVCQDVEEAGYQVFDEETLAYFAQMYGPPIPRESTAPIPRPPTSQTPGAPGQARGTAAGQGLAGQPGTTSVSGQAPTFAGQPGSIGQTSTTIFGRPGTAGQGFRGQVGSPGQGFTGQTGATGQGITTNFGQTVTTTTGQGFTGQTGTTVQGFTSQTGTSGQGFKGQTGATGQGTTTTFGHPGTSTAGQGFRDQPATTTTGQTGTTATGQGFTGTTTTTQGFAPQGFSGQGFSGQSFAGQAFTGQSFPGQGFTGQGFTGQTFPGQVFPGQGFAGQAFPGQVFPGQGFAGQAFPGQVFPGQGFAGQGVFGQRTQNGSIFQSHFQPGSPGHVFTGQVGMTSHGQIPTPASGQVGMTATGLTGPTTTGQTTTTIRGHTTTTILGQTTSSRPTSTTTGTPQGPGEPRGGSHRGHPAHITSRGGHQQPSPAPPTQTLTQYQPFPPHVPSPVFTPISAHSRPAFHNPHMPQASTVLSPRMPMGPQGTFIPGHPGIFLSNEQQSLEMFGMGHMMTQPQLRAQLGRSISAHPGFSPAPLTQGDLSLMRGQLLAHRQGLTRSSDLSFLQTPRSHPDHQFFNGVRTLMAGVLENPGHQQQQQQHHRARRSPLPHATPGNVFETRLVGCRAGAQRDINAKCRDTILPATAPVKRNLRAVPPVPPRPGCPQGQAYDRRRRCVATNSAVNSINAFNLGK